MVCAGRAPIEDASGADVSAYVIQYRGESDFTNEPFCGRTEKPVRIRAGGAVEVYVYPEDPVLFGDDCTSAPAATPTTGIVTATFASSRREF